LKHKGGFMTVMPNYVPREYKTVNIMLVVKDAKKALQFYNSAFGAEITMKLEDPDGVVVHAEMRIEDTVIMLAEEDPRYNMSPLSLGGSGVIVQLYTGDAEGMFETAINAGAEEIFPIKKQFYGDRAGRVRDPFGHLWIISTHVEDVAPKEMQKRFNDLYS
jgi:PhnB protein